MTLGKRGFIVSDCCAPTVADKYSQRQSINSVRVKKFVQELNKMAKIESGPFDMGTNNAVAYPLDREGPKRKIELQEFWIDRTAVSNKDFASFVESTGYITEAEYLGWSFVPKFLVPNLDSKFLLGQPTGIPWWAAVKDANWRQPLGPKSSFVDLQNHPVVHISWDDANAFAQWCGKRLPTEAEWEKAAKGGSENTLYPWGDKLMIDGNFTCNIWQGYFPDFNSGEDGYLGTAPVNSFEPNGFGLYNVCGNVWEWCYDWWSNELYPLNNQEDELNHSKSVRTDKNKVIKGGSFLCHDSYCNRYRPSARTSQPPNSPTAHIGFRCVWDTNLQLIGSR